MSTGAYGIERLKEIPLGLRLIREVHTVLIVGMRGAHRTPGEFRRSQNWIGGSMPADAVFVPPVARALDELEHLGIAREVADKPRSRVYVYQEYVEGDEGRVPSRS